MLGRSGRVGRDRGELGTAERGKRELPPRFESVADLRAAVLEFYARLCGLGRFAGATESVRVGIVDSVYEPGESFRERESVTRTVDLLAGVAADDTTGHGTVVADLVSEFTTNAEFEFYRVVQENGRVLGRHLVEAIGTAHLVHEVDVLNVSLGNDHSGDGNGGCDAHRQPCKVREAAQQAAADGIPVVSAAGNAEQFDSVCCPGLADPVICVGGFVSRCTARLDAENPMSLAGRDPLPPCACWVRTDGDAEPGGVYCTGLGCSPDHDCEDHRELRPWRGNVRAVGGKPDVLAPAAVPVPGASPPILHGTSWSTAFVSATAAEAVAGVRDAGEEVSPATLRESIRAGAGTLDDGTERLFRERATLECVYDELGLHMRTTEGQRNWW